MAGSPTVIDARSSARGHSGAASIAPRASSRAISLPASSLRRWCSPDARAGPVSALTV